MNWILANKEWLFSGVGVTTLLAIFAVSRILLRARHERPSETVPSLGLSTESLESPASVQGLKVLVKPGFVSHPSFGTIDTLSIEVQNHATISMFLAALSLHFRGKQKYSIVRDCVTGQYLKQSELRPGQNFVIHVNPKELLSQGRSPSDFTVAVATDAIDRCFQSAPNDVTRALEAIRKRSPA